MAGQKNLKNMNDPTAVYFASGNLSRTDVNMKWQISRNDLGAWSTESHIAFKNISVASITFDLFLTTSSSGPILDGSNSKHLFSRGRSDSF
jgi:hypothetical protein